MSEILQTAPTLEPYPVPLDILKIQSILPHRYPFLLVDRILEIERKKRILGIKNVTVNEPFFNGHFPTAPIMPGVMLVESIAQTGGILFLIEIPDRDSKLMVLTGIEKAKFRRAVVPGDQLRIEVELLLWKAMSMRGEEMIAVKAGGRITVEDKLCCEATINCQLVNRPKDAINLGQAAAAAARDGVNGV
jgi:3-hydroxyacyl-[acyl-carrier-protein] dehydratase